MELLDLGRKPVSETSPAGTDARYEPEYDQLQQEIDKLSSATAGGAIDWKHVVKLSSTILFSKSKDLKVASYLGAGLINLKGVEGISAGAQVFLDLVTNFWDTLYPAKKRMRGRFGAISWWMENAEKYLKNYEGDELPQATVDQLDKRITDLDSILAEKSEDAPVVRDLSGYVQRLPVEAPPKQEAPQTSDTAPVEGANTDSSSPQSSSGTAQPQAAVSVGSITSPEEAAAGIKAGVSALAPVAEYLLANDLTDPAGYRLRRIAAWMPISNLPPAEGGRTMIPGPEGPVNESIASQLGSSDFTGAIRAAESRIETYLFWLDLSRMTAEALKGLGDQYTGALKALEFEVLQYVTRLPGLAGLSFADGTPFADPKTRSWLQSLGGSAKGDSAGGSSSADPVSEVMDKAAQLASSKKLFDAVSLINDSCYSAKSVRDRFRLQSGLTGLLVSEDQAGVAHAHAADLIDIVDRFGLEKWEPELALQGLRAAYGAMVAEGGPDSEAKSFEILQRISRLDPAEALKINGFN